MQLLYYQAPMTAVLLMLIVPFFDPLTGPKGVFDSERTMADLVSICFHLFIIINLMALIIIHVISSLYFCHVQLLLQLIYPYIG